MFAVVTAAAAGVPGAWVSNASTGIVLPALVHSSPKLCRLWLETTLYVPEGRTSMPSKASREAPSTVAGSGVTVGRPAAACTSSTEPTAVALICVAPLNSPALPVTLTLSPMATPSAGLLARNTKTPSDAPGVASVDPPEPAVWT